MSYHTVLRALEAPAGVSASQRFWLAVRHAIRGHEPYSRYQRAGLSRAAEGATAGDVERWVLEWAWTDINPTVQIGRISNSVAALAESYNAFNRRVCVGVLTTVRAGAGSRPELVREMRSSKVDPEPCKLATVFAMGKMMADVAAREGRPAGEPMTVSDLGRLLGVSRSAGAELAVLFETKGSIAVGEAARSLGCSRRTLERALKEDGGSPEELKIATRLLRAVRLMGSSLSLTQIAIDAGYSDSSHMSRAFMASCGLTPTEVRRAAYPRASEAAKNQRGAPCAAGQLAGAF